MLDDMILNELTRQIISQHSFQFNSFSKAKKTISISSSIPIEYTFDCLSLYAHSHNLDDDSASRLNNKLYSLFIKHHTREEIKTRFEYGTLFHFALRCPEYMNMQITKTERPDFVLINDNKRIGLEVTQFTTKEYSVFISITRENFGKGKSSSEIREHAYTRHGEKSEAYEYSDHNGMASIEIPLYDTSSDREAYESIVIQKIDAYQNIFLSFNEFIILCDARDCIALRHKFDSESIVRFVQAQRPQIHGFTLCILRDSDALFCVDRFQF